MRHELRRRLNALLALLKPAPNSLEARITRLFPEDQADYRHFTEQQCAWIRDNPDRNLYKAMLTGDAPSMPTWLIDQLSGCPARITASMTADQAADIYRQFTEGD